MVDFTPTEWQEGEEGGTPITADQLNRMEHGIEDDATAATAAQAAAATAQSAASTAQSAAATAQSAASAAQSAASTAESDATTAQGTATAAQSAAATAATAAAAASTAAATAQGTANAAYVKPGPGIPKTDLTFAVQTSLGKADTAYQAPAVVGAGSTQAAALAAIAGAPVRETYKQLARTPDALIAGSVTRDATTGVATSAPVVWPDGTPGTYTAITLSTTFPGAVDSYSITYGSPVTATYTQPAVTRDSTTGAVTAEPQIVVT